jgi:hypothetical protein
MLYERPMLAMVVQIHWIYATSAPRSAEALHGGERCCRCGPCVVPRLCHELEWARGRMLMHVMGDIEQLLVHEVAQWLRLQLGPRCRVAVSSSWVLGLGMGKPERYKAWATP